jgi:hypothetical protein
MLRLACLAVFPVVFILFAACASNKPAPSAAPAYSGTVQKAYEVTKQGKDIPGMNLLDRVGTVLGPKLRRSGQTHQYVLRTPTGQVMAQSDAEFAVGDCLDVIPRGDDARGPAFRLGEAQLVRSENCPAPAESHAQSGN